MRAALFEAIGQGGPVDQYHVGLWRDADTIEIRREAPVATGAGKVLPFHLLRRTDDLQVTP